MLGVLGWRGNLGKALKQDTETHVQATRDQGSRRVESEGWSGTGKSVGKKTRDPEARLLRSHLGNCGPTSDSFRD